MIFSKNKSASGRRDDSPSMRSRDREPGKHGANPLARRFLVDDEPETIDLEVPDGFPGPEQESEPETRVTAEEPEEAVAPARLDILSHDAATGKFHAHPGSPDIAVLLNGEPVTAATELRRGDRIRIGDTEFEFLS